MAVKPACAVTAYKFGELIVQITEITLKLPLFFRSGFFTVRDTAPCTECPVRIAGITVRTPQISPCDNGQDAGKPLAVQNAVKGKPSEISSVLFAIVPVYASNSSFSLITAHLRYTNIFCCFVQQNIPYKFPFTESRGITHRKARADILLKVPAASLGCRFPITFRRQFCLVGLYHNRHEIRISVTD